MNAKVAIVLILISLICVPLVAAEQTSLLVTVNNDFLTVNGNPATISVLVKDQSTGNPIPGVPIHFSVNNPSLGELSPLDTSTGIDGYAQTVFTPNSLTGTAEVTVNASPYGYWSGKLYIQGYPDTTLIGSPRWVIAGDTSHPSTLVFTATNQSNPVPMLDISYTLSDSTMGVLNLSTAKTNSQGISVVKFTPSTKSGNVTINATAVYREGENTHLVSKEYLQRIDHNFPYKFDSPDYPDYQSEVQVANTTPIIVRMLDQYGNVIDSKRETDEGRTPEEVFFSVESSPSLGYYPHMAKVWDGSYFLQNATFAVNESGIAETILQVDAKPGINYVLIRPLVTTVADKYIQVVGVATGIPTRIVGYVLPVGEAGNNPWVYTGTDPSDDSRKFTLTYHVTDEFGNGLQLEPIEISILAGAEREDYVIVTNATGYASFQYGPRSMAIRDVVVNAVPADNRNVTANPIMLDFISTDPTNLIITANPQTMASLDVKSTAVSQIKAKVINDAGDGVSNESVTFSISNIHYDESYSVTQAPYLESSSAVTDENGYAIVNFKPGKFTTTYPNYDSTATGHCYVVATWTNPSGVQVNKQVEVTWKNYPYLNVLTFLDKETVNVSDTVQVTVRLVGDGYKMEKKPIDVIICHDRSGSMLKDNPDRMVSAMAAAVSFVQNTVDQDRKGLVSFGNYGTTNIYNYDQHYWAGIDQKYVCYQDCHTVCWWWYCWDECDDVCEWQNWHDDDTTYITAHYPGNNRYYSDYATVDTNPALDFDSTNVTNAINRLVPMGGTPLRYGLYKSIKEINNNPRDGAVKAIILITDGDYNWYGDPLARGIGYTTAQKSVTSYTDRTQDYTRFGDLTNQNLSRVAYDNNIKIYTIAFSSDISSWTNSTLKTLAEGTGGRHYVAPTGSDLLTIYDLIAGQLREEAGVNTEMGIDYGTVEVNTQILPGSDVLDYIATEPLSTNTTKYNSKLLTTEYDWIDHTSSWETDQSFPFNIGTMYLNDWWEAKMTFRVNMSGNIKLFNNSVPAVWFDTVDDGRQSLPLPDTYLFASLLQSEGAGYGTFNETEFEVTNIENTLYEWTWQRDYTGDLPLKEQYFVSVDGGHTWTQVGERILSPEEARDENTGKFRYDIRDLITPGVPVTVDFRLTGRAIDAPSPQRVQEETTFNQSGIYILLQ